MPVRKSVWKLSSKLTIEIPMVSACVIDAQRAKALAVISFFIVSPPFDGRRRRPVLVCRSLPFGMHVPAPVPPQGREFCFLSGLRWFLVQPRFLGFKAGAHQFVALFRSVVKSAEPLVDRDQAVPVVHLKELVVQVVNVSMAIDRGFIRNLDLVEANVPRDRAKPRIVQLIQRDDRVRRQDQVVEGRCEIQQVLNGMHRK